MPPPPVTWITLFWVIAVTVFIIGQLVTNFWTVSYWGGTNGNLAEIVRNLMLSIGVFGAGIGLWLAWRKTGVLEAQRNLDIKKHEAEHELMAHAANLPGFFGPS